MAVIMFPGQGAQSKALANRLFTKYQVIESKAAQILGYSLQELVAQDSEKINQTRYTQPLMFLTNALLYEESKEALNLATQPIFIGHSLGEYNALYAAGVFDFETGLKIVDQRAKLMASCQEHGGMVAIVGLDIQQLEKLQQEYGFEDLDIANYNTPTQIVLSGPIASIRCIRAVCMQEEIKAVPLQVSGPFHSRYLKPQAEEFQRFIEAQSFNEPCAEVIANVSAMPYRSAQEVKQLLSQQIYKRVLWSQTIESLKKRGESDFIEIGEKSILKSMVYQIN